MRTALRSRRNSACGPLVAHCYLGLGKLFRGTGNGEEAREHLTSATSMYREMEMTYWLQKGEAEVGKID